MFYSDIKDFDISNGPGIRVSLFVSGCTHHCKGCFNPETWDFNYGKEFTTKEVSRIVDMCKRPFIKGLTILGGDPMEPKNVESVAYLCNIFKKVLPDKSIWLYTGFIYGELFIRRDDTFSILKSIDVLVDGEFVQELKKPGLYFKGSSNQRTIDVKKTMESGEIVLVNQ